MRYQAYDYGMKLANGWHQLFDLTLAVTAHPLNPYAHTFLGRAHNATLETAMRMTKRYDKLGFDIDSVLIRGKSVPVCEEVVSAKPFCDLVHFKRCGHTDNNKVLLVAPLSGHHATLLKATVQALLADHEVYVTDWLDARGVPLAEGDFNFDRYVAYLIEFIQQLGADVHLIAICQPTVQALVATAVLAQAEDPATPKSLTLMAGPIDTRRNPTRVNQFAAEHSLEWFRRVAIMQVPAGYPGVGREVYPGFLQLGGFLSMNLNSHSRKLIGFFNNLLSGDQEDADSFRAFYDEYLAVLDMPAEFYLETIERVFKNHDLPENNISYRGQPVVFSAIDKTALLTVEGANDDICGIGQTQAAQTLCTNIPDSMRRHHLQQGAGHYGIFSGSKFRQSIRPLITEFIHQHSD